MVPLDEALVQCAVDVSGRPYCVHTGEPDGQAYVADRRRTYLGSLTRHVFETLAFHAQIALHVRVLAGRDPHHLVEAQFKAFARAFRDAVAIDPRETGVPSHQGLALSRPSVVVLDYGSGNLRSAVRALERAGAEVTLTGRPATAAMDADGLVVPGVGAFAACMAGLRAVDGRADRSAAGWPAAGRCWASASACRCCSSAASSTASRPRAATSGRAWSSGCRRPSCRTWAGTPSRCPPGSRLFAGVEDERFYFVHSYGVRDWTLRTNGRTRAPLVTWASTAATGSSPRSRTARCAPPSSTRRSPATPAPRCCATGWRRCEPRMSKERAQPPGRARARGGVAEQAAPRRGARSGAARDAAPGERALTRLAAQTVAAAGRPGSLAERRRRSAGCRRLLVALDVLGVGGASGSGPRPDWSRPAGRTRSSHCCCCPLLVSFTA